MRRLTSPLLTIALMLGSLLIGCSSTPSASLVGARVTGLAVDHVDIAFDVEIDNPTSTPLAVTSARGSLQSNILNPNAPFLELAGAEPGSVPARNSLTIPLAGRLDLLPLLSSVANVRPGDEVPYTAKIQVALDQPGVGPLDLPEITREGKLPILAMPEISVKEVSWPSLSFRRISGPFTLSVKNTNKFSLGPGVASGSLTLTKQSFMSADKQISTLSASLPTIGAGQTEDLELNVSFNPRDLFDLTTLTSLFSALGDSTRLKATGILDAQTPYAPVNLNFESK